MTKKGLTRQQREYLRQIILDCTLRRLSTSETLAMIKEKLHVAISERYLFTVKKNILDAAGEQVNYLMQNRNAYLSEYFERIAEQKKFQRETWELFYAAKADNDRSMQLSCIKQLQDISVYLTNLYNLIPNITGLQFQSDFPQQKEGVSYEDNPEYQF